MRRIAKLLLPFIFISIMFTGCIDYVATRLPPYPATESGPYLQQFDNVVGPKYFWLTEAHDNGGTEIQEKLIFNVHNHTFIKEVYTWSIDYNQHTDYHSDRKRTVYYGQYWVIRNGEICFRYTDANYKNPNPKSPVISYTLVSADEITLNGKMYGSSAVVNQLPITGNIIIKDYTGKDFW